MIRYLLIAILLMPSIVHADITSGLVGYWNLNDGSGTSALDGSGRGNTGTLTNGPTWTLGKRGKAVSLDGSNDYITVPNNTAFDFGSNQDFTVSLWAKTTQAASGIDDYPNLVSKEDGVATRQGYEIVLHDNTADSRWVFAIMVAGVLHQVYGATDIADGAWHHLVVKRSGSDIYTYQDGVLANSASASSGSLSKNIPLQFGQISGGSGCTPNGCRYNGELDEIRIYDRALSAGDVTELYNLGNSTPLLAWWKFDDGSGTLAEDSSGNGNHGTLNNSPTWTTGQKNDGLSFDGINDYISIPDNSTLQPTAVTVSAWVKLNSLTTTTTCGGSADTYGYIVFKRNTRIGNFEGFSLAKNSAGFSFNISSSDGTQDGADFATTPVTGVWYHVAGVFNKPDINIYVNGVAGTGDSHNFDLDHHTRPVFIGRTGECGGAGEGNWDSYFPGVIDDVRIYNYALSASEVAGLYDASTKRSLRGNGVINVGTIN